MKFLKTGRAGYLVLILAFMAAACGSVETERAPAPSPIVGTWEVSSEYMISLEDPTQRLELVAPDHVGSALYYFEEDGTFRQELANGAFGGDLPRGTYSIDLDTLTLFTRDDDGEVVFVRIYETAFSGDRLFLESISEMNGDFGDGVLQPAKIAATLVKYE